MKIPVLQESDWTKVGSHQSHHLMKRSSLQGHEILVIDFKIHWRCQEKDIFFSRRKGIQNIHKVVESRNIPDICPSFVQGTQSRTPKCC